MITSARFDQTSISDHVVLEVETEDGEVVNQQLEIEASPRFKSIGRFSMIARLAAATRLKELDSRKGLETALNYHLVSPWTNLIVTASRPESEQALDIPHIRKVPQTLAAGWGGVGMVKACLSQASVGYSASVVRSEGPRSEVVESASIDYLDIPAFLREKAEEPRFRRRDDSAARPELPTHFEQFINVIDANSDRLNPEHALDLLRESGLESEFHDVFQHAGSLGLNIEVVAAIALSNLLSGPLGDYLSMDTKNAVSSLQDYAQKVKQTIRAIGRHGAALGRVTQSSLGLEVLRGEHEHTDARMFEHFAMFDELLDHVQHSTQRSIDLIKDH